MSGRTDFKKQYAAKLRDPRWQRKRLEVLERDEFTCQLCCDSTSTLMVHHRYYEGGRDPWDYPMGALVTLCEICHQHEHEERPSAERALLDALRRADFMADDIKVMARGFYQLHPQHQLDVIAAALEHALLAPEAQARLLEEYFSFLDEWMKKKKEADNA